MMAEILAEMIIGRTKTNLMQKCNLNYKQIEMYTKFLLEKKFLTKKSCDNGLVKLVVSQRGKDFIKVFHRLEAQLEYHNFNCS